MDDDVPAGAGTPSILWKAFAILDTFEGDRPSLSLGRISRSSGLPKSTAHRVIGMLVELGALERVGEEYRIGPTMFSYGTRTPQIALRDTAAPHVRRLASTTGQVVQLAVLRGHEVLYVEKVGGHRSLTPICVGDRLGAHMTALGKAILAFSTADVVHDVLDRTLERRTPATITDGAALATELAAVRDRHLAIDREEVLAGLRCVGVPILASGRAIAAISIAYPATGGSGHTFVGALRDTAAHIAHSLDQGRTPAQAG